MRMIVFVAMLAVTGGMLRAGVAQKASTPKPQDKVALGEEEVKQLLLLIDTEKKGKDLQARVDEGYGSGIRQAGHEQERRVRRQGTNAIEIACKPLHKCREMTEFQPQALMGFSPLRIP
jgi:hypothetical protein